jgi:hypothetical protein
MRTLVLAALLAAVTSWAAAQRASVATPAHFTAPPPPSARSTSIRGLSAFTPFRAFHHSNSHQSVFYPFGIFPDSSYPDNPPPVSDSSPLQADLLLQALAALGANQPPAKSDSQSLLIELQGDRYVSLTNAETSNSSSEPIIIPRALKKEKDEGGKLVATRELLPVTLLFRDGHREEVHDYTIADGIIYARGDFYNDGYWNKKIELSALDLRETVKSNQARGVHFVLPNAPNEVITRP